MPDDSDNVLKKYATSVKAKELLKEFLKEKSTSDRASALAGVCLLVGDNEGHKEISKMLDGSHTILFGLPLQTLERFWSKHIKQFGNQRLVIPHSGIKLTMINADVMLSKINERLYYIHARVVGGGL